MNVDLLIILIATLIVLGIVLVFNKQFNDFAYNKSINILARVLVIGICGQFGIAGLGITIVSIYRKESFLKYGLTTKNIIHAILLSVLCCVPDFNYNLVVGNVHPWCPFIDVNTTKEVLASGFPYNVLAMLVTGICWGFFEGFNYVVIQDKLSERFPSRFKYFDWGAFICAIMCILIHGAVGITPKAITEMIVTIILIYGMLLVRKQTGNAWGCVLIFILYWNAL